MYLKHHPKDFLESSPENLADILPGPSLIRFRGEQNPPLFIATLLHGNEPTGIQAIQKLAKKIPGREDASSTKSGFVSLAI